MSAGISNGVHLEFRTCLSNEKGSCIGSFFAHPLGYSLSQNTVFPYLRNVYSYVFHTMGILSSVMITEVVRSGYPVDLVSDLV